VAGLTLHVVQAVEEVERSGDRAASFNLGQRLEAEVSRLTLGQSL